MWVGGSLGWLVPCTVQAVWPWASHGSPSDCLVFYNVRSIGVMLALPTQPFLQLGRQEHLKIFLMWNCSHTSSLLLLNPARQNWGLVRILNGNKHNITNGICFLSFYYIPGTMPRTADTLFPVLTATSASWQICFVIVLVDIWINSEGLTCHEW